MSVTEGAPAPQKDASGTPVAEHFAVARTAFRSGRTRPLAWRKAQLEGLMRFLEDCEPQIAAVVDRDLGRESMGTFMADLAPARREIRHTLAALSGWMKPTKVAVNAATAPGKAWTMPEPKGVVLIIGAWNFPILLTIHPLVSALAAGNTALVKPSELSDATAELLAELLPRYVDPEAVRVVNGGAEVSRELTGLPVDHTFFTGSTAVGRQVMAASAVNLTPVTLELGGKSPVIVAADANIEVAARRIAWAKSVNAGQACIAPDYVIVEESARAALVERLIEELPLRAAAHESRIVNQRHHDRLVRALNSHGGHQIGGEVNAGALTISPALVTDPDLDSELMRDEIFGPILPLISVPNIDDAIDFINDRAKPLALYLFTESRDTESRVLDRTSSGSVGINHVLYQLLVGELPFGGVGASGMGRYHGRHGFDTFSHHKAILRKSTSPDLAVTYPPYSPTMQAILRRVMG